MLKLAFCLALLSAGANAQADTLRIGTTGDYQPVTWLNEETGTFEGLDIALVEAFARDHGHEVTFVHTSWPELMTDLNANLFDVAVGGISYTDTRAQQALVSDTIRTDGKVALTRCGDEARFDNLEKINRPTVRVVENPGGTNEKFARANTPAATLTVLGDNHAPFRALLAQEADVMFTDGIEAAYKEAQGQGLCAVKPDAPYTHIRKVFLFRQDATGLHAAFNNWLRARADN
ncbi:transporter substrate-binding domain-containing protein [Kordiimonas aestuarii]|uniref:transporter substrate-binding domain-containing protein n=1 Tax=Kordiimonas aestuarii TaxID=1005925 RepID=UPI0021D0C8E8|nr:transporter substrate-binding domain-containing protein [Kordiimonas aestuarii]